MDVIYGQTISCESVQIDNKHFISCILIDCVLEYSGGMVAFEQTRMRGCRHIFYGEARRTLHYLQGVGLMPPAGPEWGEYCEKVH